MPPRIQTTAGASRGCREGSLEGGKGGLAQAAFLTPSFLSPQHQPCAYSLVAADLHQPLCQLPAQGAGDRLKF